MLATVVVMPGGLVVLVALACAFLLMRSTRGRIALASLKKRVPDRVKAPLRRLLVLAQGEQLFLEPPTQAPST